KPPSDQPPAPVLAWADSLDLSNLKSDDELRLGSELHRLVLTHVPPLETGSLKKRAVETARHITNTPYQITVLDSDAVNAFSHPGGYLYVCRGLFDMIGSDEDYALEFVLGHEIAHLELQ